MPCVPLCVSSRKLGSYQSGGPSGLISPGALVNFGPSVFSKVLFCEHQVLAFEESLKDYYANGRKGAVTDETCD